MQNLGLFKSKFQAWGVVGYREAGRAVKFLFCQVTRKPVAGLSKTNWNLSWWRFLVMLETSKDWSSLRASEVKTWRQNSWPQPCSVMYCRHHFSSCLAVESLFLEQQGHRCAALPACEHTPSSCHGESPSPLPTSVTDLLRNGISGTFIKKALIQQVCWSSQSWPGHSWSCCPVLKLLRAQFNLRHGEEHIPWAAARACFWGDGFSQGYRSLASTQLWAQGCWPLLAGPGGGVSQGSLMLHQPHGKGAAILWKALLHLWCLQSVPPKAAATGLMFSACACRY